MKNANMNHERHGDRRMLHALSAAVAALALGCAAQQGEPEGPSSDTAADTAATASGLKLGDHGSEVRFVHDYLTRYGYFQSDLLAEKYPGWRPLLAEAPPDPDDFDEVLEAGVRGFQDFYGLPVTGVVDDATLAAMRTQRCSHPDSFPNAEDKFALLDQQLGEGDCTVKSVGNTKEITWQSAGEETDPQRLTEFQNALNEWSRATSIRFRKVSSHGCIVLMKGRQMLKSDRADPADTKENPLAVTSVTYNKTNNKIVRDPIYMGTKRIDGTPINFFFGTSVDPNKFSARVTLLHEIGHALGLNHSSHPALRIDRSESGLPIMFPSQGAGDNRWFLTDDDQLAVHFALNTETVLSLQRNQFARSIDVARNGDLWEVDATTGGLRCNGQDVFGKAVQVAVDYSRAWHVNAAGELWRNRFVGCQNATWDRISAPPLSYVAANNDGIVWALGKAVTRGTAEHDIFVFDGTKFVKFSGFGTRIAVDPYGTAFHVNSAGELYYTLWSKAGCNVDWSSPSFGSNCWQLLPGAWRNVHAGKNSFIWMISKSPDLSPWVFNTNFKTAAGKPCDYVNDKTCTYDIKAQQLRGWSNMADVVTDGDSRIYLREGIFPADGGPDMSGGVFSVVQ